AEDRAEIKLLVDSLSRDQREALLLVEWLGLSSEEAGEVLGIRPESVRSRLHRARASLKQRFGGIDE
ncbi:MAG: RNA polymerase subunit sigma-70, partial [Actinomycetota bacterium]|nr:RNA polymerase subunit sigma-70 [Actinomycetota bacterium]